MHHSVIENPPPHIPQSSSPVYFFGHHKCATGWIDSILREVCFHMGWTFRIVHDQPDFAYYGGLKAFVEQVQPDVVAYTNADITHVRTLPEVRGFHVIRDPRDLIVSAYFSHRYSHTTENWSALVEHRKRLQQVSKEEGLLLEMQFSAYRLAQMQAWNYDQPNVLEIKLEDLSPRPLETFTRIFDHLGLLDPAAPSVARRLVMLLNTLNRRGRRYLPGGLALWPFRTPQPALPAPTLARILDRKSFRRLAGGREKGQEDIKSHYRKGQAGDWKNHFTPEHLAVFKRDFNDVLVKLGYEQDDRW